MILIMLGAPGTGKGTVAKILAKNLKIPQISTGDIFRENIKRETEIGKLAKQYIDKGQLVPDDVTIGILNERLKEDDTKNGIILDGFPRNLAQAEHLDEYLKANLQEVTMVINLTTPEEELINRIKNRRVCPKCKEIFNLQLRKPKQENICDKCGTELTIRKDDNEETFRKRLIAYTEQTEPLIGYYMGQDKLQNFTVSESINKMGKDVAMDIIAILGDNK